MDVQTHLTGEETFTFRWFPATGKAEAFWSLRIELPDGSAIILYSYDGFAKFFKTLNAVYEGGAEKIERRTG